MNRRMGRFERGLLPEQAEIPGLVEVAEQREGDRHSKKADDSKKLRADEHSREGDDRVQDVYKRQRY